ncbi:hypothetical protein P8625_06860 [Tenacibaculum tangerinum]|uniref:Bacteriocin n=1 Tax=Tenacibaculum tangerinum TaxID=3038772 RepID=A0ABY8L641_9FLAO|nr:hypothetical protein [Tenacibaculum tangerinum]WGH76856.1 hypothetical protein P8625_06860 [Tenacibaculum tangerinum]
MKKQILNLGKALDKKQQSKINGGFFSCVRSSDCSGRYDCCSGGTCINTSYAFLQPYCS